MRGRDMQRRVYKRRPKILIATTAMHRCHFKWMDILRLLVILTTLSATDSTRTTEVEYSNSVSAGIRGGLQAADRIAKKYGFRNRGKIGNLDGVYLFEIADDVGLGINCSTEHPVKINDSTLAEQVMQNAEHNLMQESCVSFVQHQKLQKRAKRAYSAPTDPEWSQQWSLLNTGQIGGSMGRDLNVEPAWMQGINGEGIVVAVVDDGVWHTHADLSPNFDREASYDFVDDDTEVTPGSTNGEVDNHGTSVAGEIAMVKDNGVCGVGVAYKAKIAGLRLLSGSTTDATEASALGYKTDHIHIYSNSWGPFDNGFLVEGPGPLLKAVLETGVKTGRDGRGSIYVWAAGNGGQKGDSCAADGYASSIYTIAVSAVDQYGIPAYYDERCSSKMAVTFNHNALRRKRNQVTTTHVDGSCRDDFMGTSAACPLVSGAIALALQANPSLTWRDVQYLVAYTSKRDHLKYTGDWKQNGAGLWISRSFGFGAIDTEALVTRARNWINVPEQLSYSIQPEWSNGIIQSGGHPIVIRFSVEEGDTNIRFLEHVVVEISLSIGGANDIYSYTDYFTLYNFQGLFYTKEDLDRLLQHDGARRGDISISLRSPHRTLSLLLPYRSMDFINSEGFISWPFMSVLHWGEDPGGTWKLTISYKSQVGYVNLTSVSVTLYGTETVPETVGQIPSECDPACKSGCAANGPQFCDSCMSFRNATTLECIESCDGGLEAHNGYCTNPTDNYTYTYVRPSFPHSSSLNSDFTSTPVMMTSTSSTVLGITSTTSKEPVTSTVHPSPSKTNSAVLLSTLPTSSPLPSLSDTEGVHIAMSSAPSLARLNYVTSLMHTAALLYWLFF